MSNHHLEAFEGGPHPGAHDLHADAAASYSAPSPDINGGTSLATASTTDMDDTHFLPNTGASIAPVTNPTQPSPPPVQYIFLYNGILHHWQLGFDHRELQLWDPSDEDHRPPLQRLPHFDAADREGRCAEEATSGDFRYHSRVAAAPYSNVDDDPHRRLRHHLSADAWRCDDIMTLLEGPIPSGDASVSAAMPPTDNSHSFSPPPCRPHEEPMTNAQIAVDLHTYNRKRFLCLAGCRTAARASPGSNHSRRNSTPANHLADGKRLTRSTTPPNRKNYHPTYYNRLPPSHRLLVFHVGSALPPIEPMDQQEM